MAKMSGRSIARLLLALGVVVGSGAARSVADEPKPAGGQDEPALEGEAKAKYEADTDRFRKRYATIKTRDGIQQFLNELEADGSRAARDFLMQYAKTVKSAEYRVQAFGALTKIGGAKVNAFLCGKDGIKSGDSLVQQEALDALGKGADKGAVQPMIDLLGDASLKIEVVGALCIALGKLSPSDPNVETALLKAASDRRDTIRANAVEALGYVASEKAMKLLLETLKSEKNARVRAGAATGLGHAGKQEAIPALEDAAANDKAEQVKAAAIKSLRDLGATGK